MLLTKYKVLWEKDSVRAHYLIVTVFCSVSLTPAMLRGFRDVVLKVFLLLCYIITATLLDLKLYTLCEKRIIFRLFIYVFILTAKSNSRN